MSDSHVAAMYTHFFRLTREPFSIVPDPRYLFMSPRHHEALAHLMYGAVSGGGIVVLTGEIGTGKTTVCRCFLERIPAGCDVAWIFNPKLTVTELLQSICEEFHIAVPHDASRDGVKAHIDALNRHLLNAHAAGRNSMLIIDEAQNLSVDVLEQLRLLTNLETGERKLLQIVLIGQPELRGMLAQPALEQLAQRVTARYHLEALSEQETASYIQHRLSTAGLRSASPFQPQAMRRIHQITQGVPRRINLLCERALLGSWAQGAYEVNRRILDKAARELFDRPAREKHASASAARPDVHHPARRCGRSGDQRRGAEEDHQYSLPPPRNASRTSTRGSRRNSDACAGSSTSRHNGNGSHPVGREQHQAGRICRRKRGDDI